ncbi:MAG: hypothetical protein H0W06_08705, partial [Chloroflexia bacterium]|nr:hypothetical protein [Chloroflexia bacterium]
MTCAVSVIALEDILALPTDRRWSEFAATVAAADRERVLGALGDDAEAMANAEVGRG